LFEKILVPLDGSEHSRRALETAIQIAQRFDGKLTLIHVYSIGGLAASPEPAHDFIQAIRRVGSRILEQEEKKLKTRVSKWKHC